MYEIGEMLRNRGIVVIDGEEMEKKEKELLSFEELK